MTELSDFLHFGTIGIIAGLTSLGAGIGQGLAGRAAVAAMDIQPQARGEISRALVMGMALIDTASIMGLTIVLIMIFGSSPSSSPQAMYANIADLGILFAVTLPGFAIGIASSLPAQQACLAIARQPFFSQKIARFMLISQSVIQTPMIFGFIIAMLIKASTGSITNSADSIRLVAAGLTVGLSSIGTIIGLGTFAREACRGLGVNREAYGPLLTLTFMSNAIIETPIVLSLVVAMALFGAPFEDDPVLGSIRVLAAALCIGIGTLGPGISSGRTSAMACREIAKNPEAYGTLSRVSLFAQGLIDTCAIYAFLVALFIVLAVR